MKKNQKVKIHLNILLYHSTNFLISYKINYFFFIFSSYYQTKLKYSSIIKLLQQIRRIDGILNYSWPSLGHAP